jgi:hypothetical protein
MFSLIMLAMVLPKLQRDDENRQVIELLAHAHLYVSGGQRHNDLFSWWRPQLKQFQHHPQEQVVWLVHQEGPTSAPVPQTAL